MDRPDQSVLAKISSHVDTILALCSSDDELNKFALIFQVKQAASQATFAAGETDEVTRWAHLEGVLKRMIDLALAVAHHILQRTTTDMKRHSITPETDDHMCSHVSNASRSSTMLVRTSSVDEFSVGSEPWRESGGSVSYAAVELLSDILVIHDEVRQRMQQYMFEHGILDYLSSALNIGREHELVFFRERYKTEHIRLIANLCYDNSTISASIVKTPVLMREILSGTCIDEENPGMIEWAKFATRNLCMATPEARQLISQMQPINPAEQSKMFCKLRPSNH